MLGPPPGPPPLPPPPLPCSGHALRRGSARAPRSRASSILARPASWRQLGCVPRSVQSWALSRAVSLLPGRSVTKRHCPEPRLLLGAVPCSCPPRIPLPGPSQPALVARALSDGVTGKWALRMYGAAKPPRVTRLYSSEPQVEATNWALAHRWQQLTPAGNIGEIEGGGGDAELSAQGVCNPQTAPRTQSIPLKTLGLGLGSGRRLTLEPVR